MDVQKPLLDRISALKDLPTLPHILLRLLEACNRSSVDLDEISSLVSKDPSLSAKILKLVNSAYYGRPQKIQEIGQAVIFLGTSGIRNMAFCACVHEVFANPKKQGRFNLKAFWWHSLCCAFICKRIAARINFSQPDEAFVSGLLHDIGKIVLWTNFHRAYEDLLKDCPAHGRCLRDGEDGLGATHDEVGAWLLDRWHFQSAVCDSVRYHHETPSRLAQAFPLTQIVSVANLLSRDMTAGTDEGARLAQQILGINAPQCRALIEQSDQAARQVADALGIDVEAAEPASISAGDTEKQITNALAREVRDVSLLVGTLEGLLAARDQEEILARIAEGLDILMGFNRLLFFLADAEKDLLGGYTQDKDGRFARKPHLAVSMRLERCLLVRTIGGQMPLDSFNAGADQPLTILDEQITRVLGSRGIYCLPLIAHQDPVGVLVVGIEPSDLPHIAQNRKLLNVFSNKGALALRLEQLKQRRLQDIHAKRADASSDLARRVVHEVNNPLSIIKNYLKILELKLSGKHIAGDEIRIINEEISRVGRLLTKLTEFSTEKAPPDEQTDINALIRDIAKLTKDSLLNHSGVELQLDLAEDLPPATAEKAELKQVFINLIKNATEAMESGGNLWITTRFLPPPIGAKRDNQQMKNKGYVEIRFRDDGPGIPEAIQEKLFDPYVSSKQGGHSGLGLSIAYNIIKSFEGNIACERISDGGAEFKIELPVREGA